MWQHRGVAAGPVQGGQVEVEHEICALPSQEA